MEQSSPSKLSYLFLSSTLRRINRTQIFALIFTCYLLSFFLWRCPLIARVTIRPEEEINLPSPEDYDQRGCPRVPISFSGMTGRLGNVISTYVNFIALQYKLGYRYHLPQRSNVWEECCDTKSFLQSVFKEIVPAST